MKRKPAKGDLRRNKLHIPHSVRRLRRTGLVRSVVPPLPTRIASLDSRGSPVPFANPLKTTKKGAAAPPPWIFPGVRFVLKLFQICKTRYRCGFGKPARSSKYSAAVSDVSCTAELVALRLSDFHTSNIQRAQKKRFARPIVRLGNPILRPPEGRFDDGNETIKRKTERQAFQARKRYFASSVSFLHTFF